MTMLGTARFVQMTGCGTDRFCAAFSVRKRERIGIVKPKRRRMPNEYRSCPCVARV